MTAKTSLNLSQNEPQLLSIVIPVWNEQEVLPLLIDALTELAKRLPCEVEWILVNDGSQDMSRSILFEWAEKDKRVKVIDFSRNFGHQSALTAGMDFAQGDAVVIMDADLQDPPELILDMLERYKEGYDVVYAQRTKRHGESLFKRITATGFYWIMRRFVYDDLPENTGDFRLMSREVVLAIRQLREGQRFLRGLTAWLGFHQIAVPFERPPRAAGETKFPITKMIRFAWDAILSFSGMPLRLASYGGSLVFLFGFLYGIFALYSRFVSHNTIPGWTSMIVLQCIIGGMLLICLGTIGEYVGRIYEEIKFRPLYVVAKTVNVEETPKVERAFVK